MTESTNINSLADLHVWSTIKTLPATLPEPSFMDRGIPSILPVVRLAGNTNGSTMGKSTPFLYWKRGVFYLQKRVPKKLVPRVGRAFVRVSLRTKDRTTAIQTAGSIFNALNKKWHAALFAIPDDIQVTGFLSAQQMTEPTLTDAAAAYIKSKGKADRWRSWPPS